jgi:hypothetical protein
MHLRPVMLCSSIWLTLMLGLLNIPASAGMLGFPAPQQQPWHMRFELAGDSFKEDLQNTGDAEATTGRALATVALGLTNWSEIFARFGTAEFNVHEALFNGNFGLAYGGGLRLRLLRLPLGVLGASAQYLRFTSNDDDVAGTRVEGEWKEVDVAVGIGTRRTGPFEFYAGGAYHQSDITLKTPSTGGRATLESKIPFRGFVGIHIYPLADVPSGKFLVNIEARFIGETPQVTLGVQYAF